MAARPIKRRLRTQSGNPVTYSAALLWAVEAIRRASEEGRGVRLSAEETRALDWAVIREHGEGGKDPSECWREQPYVTST